MLVRGWEKQSCDHTIQSLCFPRTAVKGMNNSVNCILALVRCRWYQYNVE
jgi:hypothetical protein